MRPSQRQEETYRALPQREPPSRLRGFWERGPFLNVIGVRDNGEGGATSDRRWRLEPGRKGG